MIRLRHKLFIYALRLFDQVVLFGTLSLAFDIFGRYRKTGSLEYLLNNYYSVRTWAGLLILGLIWAVIFDLLVDYNTNRLKTLRRQIFDVFKAYSISSFLLMVVATLFSFRRLHNELILFFWLTTCSLGVVGRILLRWLLMQVRRSGYNYRHLLIVGYNEQALQLVRKIASYPELGYRVVGFVKDSDPGAALPPPDKDLPVLGDIKDLKSVLEDSSVDEIMLCIPLTERFPTVCEVIRLGQDLGVVVRLFPDSDTARILSRCQIERFENNSVVTFFREQMLMQLLTKRLIDFFGSLTLILLLSPLCLAVALIIKITSPGPVFFIQPRVGMNKRIFNLYKFRSMYIDAERRRSELMKLNEMDGPVFKIKNDPRVTPFGRFIRKWSIDELPQLLNVLSGHISLVGPRPPLLSEVNQYDWLYRKRLSIKPGITCLWQISGRNEISFKQWMELDQEYINNWSLWLDIKILLKTVPAVLLRRGAS